MSSIREWFADRIITAIDESFTEANEVLGRAFEQEITASKWDWPNPPSPRDIVDTGNLRDSYTGERVGDNYDHGWSVDYALAVHEGARRTNSVMPGRPWTREPLRNNTAETAFAKAFVRRVR